MTKFTTKGERKEIRPDGAIRHGQVVSTFGPGAMVDLLDQAVVVAGLEYWGYQEGPEVGHIEAPRLRDHVVEKYGLNLALDKPFRAPPTGQDREPSVRNGIPVREFPEWFVCQKCRALVRGWDGTDIKSGRRWHACGAGGRGKAKALCVPVRFVGACTHGHLQDFPWQSFVHKPGADCTGGELYLVEGATGDFSEISVRCDACGTRRNLSETAHEELRPRCGGQRPWLGDKETNVPCNESLRLLVRTASNGYFPQVVSALAIPEPDSHLQDAVAAQIKFLEAVPSADAVGQLRQLAPGVFGSFGSASNQAIFDVVDALRSGTRPARKPLRSAEYERFCAAVEKVDYDDGGDFVVQACPVPKTLPGVVEKIVLAHKLREVRTQVGFTRLEPASMDNQGEFDLGVKPAVLSLGSKWLPASEIWGEGVFLQFSESRLVEWESRPVVQARAERLQKAFQSWRMDAQQDKFPFPGVRFYLLHSLSHLLISAIALECGYAASAIRERIYAAAGDEPMAGILLMTGTSGSEGTLGGLVAQGRRLDVHFQRAIEMGKLCSNDPVCASHTPDDDPAGRYLEGAACHGCLFVAECSCERSNRYLDRALVVPTMGHPPELAFLGPRSG